MINKDTVNKLVQEYISLKEHEYKSISSKLKRENNNFKSKIEYNTFNNYNDTHVILTYNYTDYIIREDKFFHTLNDELIDIIHFTRGKELNFSILKQEIKKHLRDYKITNDMIDLVLSINKENYYVRESGLTFIYSLNQFGINSLDDFKVEIGYKDLYERD